MKKLFLISLALFGFAIACENNTNSDVVNNNKPNNANEIKNNFFMTVKFGN